MAKFHGYIGFVTQTETAPGVFEPVTEEREYTGDFIREARNWVSSQNLNDNLQLATRISVIADPFAEQNIAAIRFVKWQGVKWRVKSFENQRPRIILSLGGVYNG